MKGLVATVIGLSLGLVCGCGGGGGGGGGGDGDTVSQATLSGSLIIPPNHAIETEPNDSPSEAEAITTVSKVSGSAAATDAGFELPDGTIIQDLYFLDADDAVRIVLTIAADDLGNNDLDLLLMNSEGDLLDSSAGEVANEEIDTEVAGTFLVGVRASKGSSAYLLSLDPLGSLAETQLAIPETAEFVPGEILVKTTPASGAVAMAQVALRFGMRLKDRLPNGVTLMTIDPETVTRIADNVQVQAQREPSLREQTIDRIRRLRREPGVVYAEPNYIRRPLLEPDDPFYDLQWHYRQINLPQGWDVSTGETDVTMAVLDTGILFDHPDLQGRTLSGYDFISDPSIANDGDGIDADATDAGDDPAKLSSSFHGTHVAGVVGSATNNGIGVAGTTWVGNIMPLRVLGVGGGIDSDIVQAIRYAAGLSNSSGTLPASRADVINMSFGSPGFSSTVNGAVQEARAAGVTLVAAAGNDNNSEPFYPASYNGVISVAAVDLSSQKAPYSNFGPQIDLAAPGGDNGRDLNGDGHPDGVLSTHGNDEGEFFYRLLAGTSMAAPHVTGIVGLMTAIHPQITPEDVDQLIAGTHLLTPIQIVRDIGEPGRDDLYGHGLIDASLAVQSAEALAGSGGEVNGPTLTISTSTLDFQDYLTGSTFEISNSGSGTLEVLEIHDDAGWLTVNPVSGAAPLTVHLTVDRRGLAAGIYEGTVTVETDAVVGDPVGTVQIVMEVGEVVLGNIGPAIVLAVDKSTLEPVAEARTGFEDGYRFTIPGLDAGTYLIIAGTDRDDDSVVCEIEDACGSSAELITVEAGEVVGEIEFPVSESSAPQSLDHTPLKVP